MFERYTEKAKRVVFFARYEASQFGSPQIETEHLLLGLLRENKALTNRFLESFASVESIRKQIAEHTPVRKKISTAVDIPLCTESKRVLAYAAEETEALSHNHIGTEHLLLGLLREETCFAAELLHERGLHLCTLRDELIPGSTTQPQQPVENGGLLSDTEAAGINRASRWIAISSISPVALLAIGLAFTSASGKYLIAIAAAWFLPVAALTLISKGRNLSLMRVLLRAAAPAKAAAYVFLSVYQFFVIGWLVPLGMGVYRVVKR